MGCRNPLNEYVTDMNYNILFDSNTPLADQLSQFDLIVTGNPATILASPATTDKQMTILIMGSYLKPEARDMIIGRACVAFNLEDFPKAIKEAFHQGLSGTYTPNDKFSDAYIFSSGSDSYSVCRTVLRALTQEEKRKSGARCEYR